MCIIVDQCAIAALFDRKNARHPEFLPVLIWLRDGKGKMVFGGTEYRRQLKSLTKYTSILVQLKKAGKLVEVNDDDVDAHEARVRGIVNDEDFDDAHIVGIVSVSRCRLVCTDDKRSIPYLKRSNLYPRGVARPLFYMSDANKRLLCDRNIADVCVPAVKGIKSLRNSLRAQDWTGELEPGNPGSP